MDETLRKIVEVHEVVLNALFELDDVRAVQCVIGSALDEWASHNGLTSKQTFAILADMAEVQKVVHAELGPAGIWAEDSLAN